jgi:hypothetical protein
VVSETNGDWGQAIQVPGLAALSERESAGVPAGVSSVSCASAGNCAAGGSYQDDGGRQQGFVVSETNGAWGRAIEVPGLRALGQNARVNSLSCASPGNCAAGGDYGWDSGSPYPWGFVVSEKDGAWGRAINVPGLGALNKGGGAAVSPVSCTPQGSCTAGGFYTVRIRGRQLPQGFVF